SFSFLFCFVVLTSILLFSSLSSLSSSFFSSINGTPLPLSHPTAYHRKFPIIQSMAERNLHPTCRDLSAPPSATNPIVIHEIGLASNTGTTAPGTPQVPWGHHSDPAHHPVVSQQDTLIPSTPQNPWGYYSDPAHYPVVPGSPQEGSQTSSTGATFDEGQAPWGNHNPKPYSVLWQQDIMAQGSQEGSQTSDTGGIFQGQPLATSPNLAASRVYYRTRRSEADRAAKKPLDDAQKYIIRCLRGNESNPSMSHDGIKDLTGFPKVTIKRVRTELKDRQLPWMTLDIYDEEGEPLFVLTVFD
ncbi:MAG: hypothetical protein J3Q66DRAFT_418268, partial [Benniella sp.]